MPAKSKSQFRLMQAIAHNNIAPKGGLTSEKASEFVAEQSPKGLPESVAEKPDAKKIQRKRQMRAR